MLFEAKSQCPDRLRFERLFWDQGLELVAGVDEVGRGCLAGPVVACAVVLPKGEIIEGIDDSKALSAKAREHLSVEIKKRAVAWSVKEIGPDDIDSLNILQASLKAMSLAVEALKPTPHAVLVDGNQPFPCQLPLRTIPKGDSLSQSVSAASIIAKVHRDQIMERLHNLYPHYNFFKNKGYPTKEHREALRRFGPCPIHRRSFRGVVQ
ncbi:Ribonuclease HII [Dissulfuribacter thermophilus]|uniref:Ribonuclease HII n=1 Tax=Dissulfuribacter thermophilus TaxID=1156395 RepID=A0A1B9F6Y7_9BACT|nr:ribonuclease HII [Dissulfuribacter thermophilus]OCC15709.1 Ribonuclease HII [Dissulfuribacter thermophilus]